MRRRRRGASWRRPRPSIASRSPPWASWGRLAWRLAADDPRYRARLARGAAVEVGLALERDGNTIRAGSRLGLHLGGRVDIPLGPAGGTSELRLRLAVRRMEGFYTPRISVNEAVLSIGDSVETYAALVSIF